jgi:hypothetical protein
LHIEAYHSQITNRKEKQRIKISKEISKKLKEKSKEKQLFYLKKEEGNIYISSTQSDSRKIRRFKGQVKPKLNGKEQIINISHISTIKHHASLNIHLVRRQQAIHDGQLGLQLSNLTVQATDRGKHSVLLVPVIQEQVVASEISDVSLQKFKASLQISFLMLESHPLKQRLLVLL